ncbi:MAG: acyltransferase family protein, partial [Acidobacteriota bacterium]
MVSAPSLTSPDTPQVTLRRSSRRPYIDWLRGIAVLIMIMWHSIDSWSVSDDRANFAFTTFTFFAGWAAPLFLFLAGVAVPFAAASQLARGADRKT